MKPNEKKKLYMYDSKGIFLREFESKKQFKDEYDSTYNKYDDKYGYKVLNGNVLSTKRLGKRRTLEILGYYNSPFVGRVKKSAETNLDKNGTNIPVQVFDLDGDLMAEFRNSFTLKMLTNLDMKNIGKKTNSGLILRYKENP